MLRITENWVMIPQLFYNLLTAAGGLGAILSAVGHCVTLIGHQGKKRASLWAGLLAGCLVITSLLLTGKVIGHRMIAG